MFLLRALFPSWRFFASVGTDIRLEVRQGLDATRLSTWAPLLQPIARTALTCIYNPRGNYWHACHNSLEHLIDDIAGLASATSDEVEKLTSYRIVQNLVRLEVARNSNRAYQFRVTTQTTSESSAQIALLSAVMEV